MKKKGLENEIRRLAKTAKRAKRFGFDVYAQACEDLIFKFRRMEKTN